MFQNLLNTILGQKADLRFADLYNNLIRHEAKIGGEVFGPIPAGRKREFFCLDEHTWVWHEQWRDNNGQQQILVTRYDVRPDGILKTQNGHYQRLTISEAKKLQQAAKIYLDRISREMYSAIA